MLPTKKITSTGQKAMATVQYLGRYLAQSKGLVKHGGGHCCGMAVVTAAAR